MSIATVEPEYMTNTRQTAGGRLVEKYKNCSVKCAIQQVINSVKQPVKQVCEQTVELLNSIDVPAAIEKANSICVEALPSGSPLWGFLLSVKQDYEHILTNCYEDFNAALLDEAAKLTGIRLANECFYDVNNPKFADPTAWFSKRISLYNPAVNFEHVCLLLHVMLADFSKASAEVVVPFYVFLKCWTQHRETMRWTIYHYIKLIRVFIFGKYSTKPFAPAQFFTNLRFGAITDQNIEVYGDVKLTTDKGNIMSYFSVFPRSHIVKAHDSECPIFFSWNELTPMISLFTANAEKLTDELYTQSTPYDFLTMLNTYDITPRIGTIRNKQYCAYKTVQLDDSPLVNPTWQKQTAEQKAKLQQLITDIPEALYIAVVNFLGAQHLKLTPEQLATYKNYIVYITYTGADGVKTVSTNRLFSQLMEAIEIRHDEHGVFTPAKNIMDVKLIDYIPDVSGGYSKAVRTLITKADKSWESYYTAANNLLPRAPVWPGWEQTREQPTAITDI